MLYIIFIPTFYKSVNYNLNWLNRILFRIPPNQTETLKHYFHWINIHTIVLINPQRRYLSKINTSHVAKSACDICEHTLGGDTLILYNLVEIDYKLSVDLLANFELESLLHNISAQVHIYIFIEIINIKMYILIIY